MPATVRMNLKIIMLTKRKETPRSQNADFIYTESPQQRPKTEESLAWAGGRAKVNGRSTGTEFSSEETKMFRS